MTFRTQFDSHARVVQPAGDRTHPLYNGRYTDTGIFVLEESGKEDLYDKIQSHAASVDIHVILDRYRRGDIDALGDPARSVFFDASELPRDYAQLLNIINDGERAFMSLPVDERAKFDHSFVQWMMQLDKSNSLDTSEVSKKVDTSDNKEVLTNE